MKPLNSSSSISEIIDWVVAASRKPEPVSSSSESSVSVFSMPSLVSPGMMSAFVNPQMTALADTLCQASTIHWHTVALAWCSLPVFVKECSPSAIQFSRVICSFALKERHLCPMVALLCETTRYYSKLRVHLFHQGFHTLCFVGTHGVINQQCWQRMKKIHSVSKCKLLMANSSSSLHPSSLSDSLQQLFQLEMFL